MMARARSAAASAALVSPSGQQRIDEVRSAPRLRCAEAADRTRRRLAQAAAAMPCAALENPAHQIGPHALHGRGTRAQARRPRIRGLGRRRQRPLRTVALLLCELALLLRDVALLDRGALVVERDFRLPARKAGKRSAATAAAPHASLSARRCWRTSCESRSSFGMPWMAAAKSAPASMKRASRASAPSR